MNDTEAVFMRLVKEGEFQIDDQGRIWRKNGTRAEKTSRYNQVQFKDHDDNWRYVHAHRVVYFKHYGDIPDHMQINHKDGNKHNNHPDNLEAVTPRQNSLHSVAVLGKNLGEKHGAAKLTTAEVKQIRELCEQGIVKRRIAEKFGIDPSNVTKIDRGVTWKHV